MQRAPLFLELILNGFFIAIYSFLRSNKLPTFIPKELAQSVVYYAVWFVPIVLVIVILGHLWKLKSIDEFLRRYVFSLIVFVPMIITWGDIEFTFWLTVIHLFSSILSLYDGQDMNEIKKKESRKFFDERFLHKLQLRPAQIMSLSFMMVILVGSFLLVLPISAKSEKSLPFIDALFTSTSATCVTGLSTISVNDDLSLFGQVILLALIQIGGLGFMTLSSSLSIFLGKSLAIKEQVLMQDLLDIGNLEDLGSLIWDIISYTAIIELVGGILLSIGFYNEGQDLGFAIYLGFFHSISAFCNAGFSIFNNSIETFATNPLINFTICGLIQLGGIGFIVLKELRSAVMKKSGFSSFSIHSRIVLVMNLFLVASGTLIILFTEFLNTLDRFNIWDKFQVAIFQSVTTRTAGFNSIPMASLHPVTIYIITLFMFIGAAPGGTGGGIKTTTFSILLQSVREILRGSDTVVFFKRTIPHLQVVRSTALTIISFGVISFFLIMMIWVEPNKSFLSLLFEVVSAFGTVGLSLGITSQLTALGKLAIVFVMFIGRIGPLTMVLAIGQRRNAVNSQVEYPEARILIG